MRTDDQVHNVVLVLRYFVCRDSRATKASRRSFGALPILRTIALPFSLWSFSLCIFEFCIGPRYAFWRWRRHVHCILCLLLSSWFLVRTSGASLVHVFPSQFPAQEFWIKPVSYLCFEAECVNIIKRGLKIQERQGRQHACRISAEVSVLGGYMDGSLHKEAIPFLDACSQGSHRRHRKSRVFFHLLYRHHTEARHSTLS